MAISWTSYGIGGETGHPKGRKAFNQSLDAIEQYVKRNEQQMTEVADEGAREAAFAKMMMIGVILAVLVIAVVSATWIALSISRALARAVGLADAELFHFKAAVRFDDFVEDLLHDVRIDQMALGFHDFLMHVYFSG